MNKEQFYDELNGIIKELTIEYVQQLRGNAEGMIEKIKNESLTSEEISSFLKEQEEKFRINLEDSIDDLYDEMLEIISTNHKLKEGIIDKIKSSFRRIYESIISKFKNLF